jgi:hypothetical protein
MEFEVKLNYKDWNEPDNEIESLRKKNNTQDDLR